MNRDSKAQASTSELDQMEKRIPPMCIAATAEAYTRSLASGREVCIAIESGVILVNASGTVRHLGLLPNRHKVTTGVRYRIDRADY